MPRRSSLSTVKGLRNLDVTQKQSLAVILDILIIFIPNVSPRDSVEFINGHIISSFKGKMELERNTKNQLYLKALDRVYISGIIYSSSEARTLEF